MTLKRILFVDEDAEDKHLLMEALDTLQMGIQCKTVNNGEEALRHLKHVSPYEVIFPDLNMPLMNGFECLKAWKAHENYKSISIIAFASSINPTELQHCQSLGAKASRFI